MQSRGQCGAEEIDASEKPCVFALTPPRPLGISSLKWATCCKVRQRTVTPPRRLLPGSIPGSPTISLIVLRYISSRRGGALKERPRRRMLRGFISLREGLAFKLGDDLIGQRVDGGTRGLRHCGGGGIGHWHFDIKTLQAIRHRARG